MTRSLRYTSQGLGALCVALCAAAMAACGLAPQAAPQPPPQAAPAARPPATPAALAALAGRLSPCAAAGAPGTQSAAGAGNTPAAQAAAMPIVADATVVHYDDNANTIVLRRGAQATLPAVSRAVGRADVLRELAQGQWLLAASLRVEAGAVLRIAAPEVRWLKLRSDDQGFVSIKALGGQLQFADTCVSSWDQAREGYDENYTAGRAFVLARDGARMDIERSDLRYLGYDGPEAYGIAWRTERTSGKMVDSFAVHNFYGVYSFEVDGLLIRGNEAAYNVMYGIDPHTRSTRLVIEGNVAHDNGKHGIILAEECSDGLVRDNVAYNNLHHGIVIFQRSNNNVVERNTAYGNGGHGINVNDAANTTVRDNTVYDNLEAGIGIGQEASKNQVLGNLVRANRGDGITLYSRATDNLLRNNTVDGNARYGIYVKSEGPATIEGNQIVGNAVGVFLNMEQPFEVSPESNQIHGNRQADVWKGAQAAAAADAGGQP
jgi:parallel beta-helix repeat protein